MTLTTAALCFWLHLQQLGSRARREEKLTPPALFSRLMLLLLLSPLQQLVLPLWKFANCHLWKQSRPGCLTRQINFTLADPGRLIGGGFRARVSFRYRRRTANTWWYQYSASLKFTGCQPFRRRWSTLLRLLLGFTESRLWLWRVFLLDLAGKL